MAPRSRLWPDPRVTPSFGAAEVDWAHPLAAGLVSYILPQDGPLPVDLVRRIQGVQNGTVQTLELTATALGRTLTGDGTTNRQVDFLTHPAIGSNGLSVCARAISLATDSNYRRIFSKGNLWILQNAGNKWAFVTNANATEYDNTVRAVVVGERVMLVGTNDGTNTKLYTNGVLGENVSPFSYSAGVATATLGCSGVDQTQRFNGHIDLVSIYNRPLRQEEAVWLAAEPYAMLRPIVRRRYFAVPAPVSPSLTPLVGSTTFASAATDRSQDIRLMPTTA